jgi:hypothetical protein
VYQVLHLLFKHKLFIKHSNCAFGASEVDYLGHIIGNNGVWVEPRNIEAMKYWPLPKMIKSLHGFLGLMGYYFNLVHNYGKIAAHLTTLLKNNAFNWTLIVDQYFHTLKEVMCTTLFLALLDCTKTFVLECDALGKGIGAILVQYGIPLAFTRKQILERNLGQSTYEKKMLDILHAMDL